MSVLSHVDSHFPSVLQYSMDDMIVSEISMQVMEPFTVAPKNISSSIHRFAISPPLPSGLTIDSHLGVIQGSANEVSTRSFSRFRSTDTIIQSTVRW